MLFVHYGKDFDSVYTKAVMNTLEELGDRK